MISLLRQLVITVPLGFALSRALGAVGIWIAFPVSELIASVAALILLKRYRNGNFSRPELSTSNAVSGH